MKGEAGRALAFARQGGDTRPLSTSEQRSAMVRRFGLLARMLVRAVFRHVRIRGEVVERIRELGAEGSLVYVMRYRSVVDYLLVNAVLLREGLPLARFAPGISTLWWRPLRQAIRWLWMPRPTRTEEHDACATLVRAGEPILLFLRSQGAAGLRRRALAAARLGPQFLREVVRVSAAAERPIVLVPLAVFRGRGFHRRESRFATLVYSVQETPGEAKRLFTTWWNREDTQVTLGREIVVQRFLDAHRLESEERLVRRLARTLQISLHREERVVQGPALLPRKLVREQVLRDPELARLMRRLAAQRGVPFGRVRREARGYIDEMAAAFNGLYFAILEFAFNRIFPRIFSGLEVLGLERVIERMREHPIVLVPCHRSHFDYLILTYIFHANYLSPPHIAAGLNLSFWPLGPLFRGAGAYFIRRSFEDNELYKMVFRKYLTFLIREGFTQEFFIEGGRTRTGKILTPKLGMLSAIVGAFVQGVRRDLYFVPVSIHYGRIPEEEAYRREVSGEPKERESLRALLRARSVLSRRFGTAYVSYGEPISLAEALGPLRERLQHGVAEPAMEEEKRRFVQRLGFRILREVNAVAVAGATSVSATALLSAPRAACRLEDFLHCCRALVGLLRRDGVRFTQALLRNEALDFREGLAWLEQGGLVERLADAAGMVLHVPAEKRTNLDFYKNNTIHFFILPALLTRALLADVPEASRIAFVMWWLDLYRWEFPLPPREAVGPALERYATYFRDCGAIRDGRIDSTHPLARCMAGVLESFREAYLAAARTLSAQREWPVTMGDLLGRLRAQHRTSLLLGEAFKPEAASVVTWGNALSRFAELGHVVLERRGRERLVAPGPRAAELASLVRQLGG